MSGLGLRWVDTARATANLNLSLLIADLPEHYKLTLRRAGATIKWSNEKNVSGACDYFNKTIELNEKEFCSFSYNLKQPSQNQLWCIATLKEEIIHYYATHLSFDMSTTWKSAVKFDRNRKSSQRDKLLRKQREHDSSDYEIKVDVTKYKKSQRAEEWLVDVILVRDYLIAGGASSEAIEKKMNRAFPRTYPLVKTFEKAMIGSERLPSEFQ